MKAMNEAGMIQSNGEGMRLIKQGAVSVDGKKVTDKDFTLEVGSHLIKCGKRRFLQLEVTA